LISALPRSGGTYVLLFQALSPCEVKVGALGSVSLELGFYLYVGSAHGGGGLQARVTRHLAVDKPLRWHMDYLRPQLTPVAVWWQASAERLEDHWAQQIPSIGVQAHHKGFGASDSRHFSHLFFCPQAPCFERWQQLNPDCACWNLYDI
jgi:Uri superfamily endonuclease